VRYFSTPPPPPYRRAAASFSAIRCRRCCRFCQSRYAQSGRLSADTIIFDVVCRVCALILFLIFHSVLLPPPPRHPLLKIRATSSTSDEHAADISPSTALPPDAPRRWLFLPAAKRLRHGDTSIFASERRLGW